MGNPNRRYQTLSEACSEAERTDPKVAAAARSFDDMVDRVVTAGELHRFRPSKTDRCPGCPACRP